MRRLILLALPALIAWTPVPDPAGTVPISMSFTRAEAIEMVEELAAIPQVSVTDDPTMPNLAVATLRKFKAHLDYLLATPTVSTVTLY